MKSEIKNYHIWLIGLAIIFITGIIAGKYGSNDTSIFFSNNKSADKCKCKKEKSGDGYKYKKSYCQYDIDSTTTAKREQYRLRLKTASYSLNIPSSVKVDTPFTIYFVLNPVENPKILAKKLEKIISQDPAKTQRIEADTTKLSSKMRVKLTGEDFEITPVEGKEFDGLKSTQPSGDTRWGWHIQAKHAGESLPLYLNVWCELPVALGGPIDMLPTLTRYINVEVTPIWLINTYWERWQWFIGGIGAVLVTAIGWWLKNRYEKNNTPSEQNNET
ncbi:hypothetical protein EST62_02655 [Chlorobaculum sp. 24CR]|uniref:hypothetical protein n=1 Tax=Chlorobaculum sp. 24CR TaxID=2508878 RepID=UPI00100B04F3|nr:hypothetical protein [Chlorobaculum sp. 24CR]RXK88558.1 hypothetical protein EST62_02655 [Chlorobaculum sp. 24CR]